MSLLDEETAQLILLNLQQQTVPSDIATGFEPFQSTKEDWVNMPQVLPKWFYKNQTNIIQLQKAILQYLSIDQLCKDNTNIYSLITVKLSLRISENNLNKSL
jgi:hypothetical protein